MSKKSTLVFLLSLGLSLSSKADSCLGFYAGKAVVAKLDYQQTLPMVLANLSPEMRIEVVKQLKISQEYDLSQVPTTRLESIFFNHIAKANEEGRFDEVFGQLLASIETVPQFKAKLDSLPPEKKAELMATLKLGILGEVQLRQYHGKGLDADIWGKIAKNVETKVGDSSRWINLSVEKKLAKIAKLTGSHIVGTKEIQVLIDGPSAFAKRDDLVSKARKSIHVLTWSVYDDVTGTRFADQMIEKKKQGIDVKIIVDALTAQKAGHNKQLERIIQNGIPVIFSRNPALFLSGHHRKAMIIDEADVIAGGMNYGDVYSHMGNKAKWRDTDVYFTGSLAERTQNLFVSEWNEQIDFQKLSFAKMEKLNVRVPKGESKAILLNSVPADQKLSGSSILKSLIALIKGSMNEIIIENAYIISSPTLEKVLSEAVQRGVRVTIITNSSKSVDEPVVSNPILASALRLKKLGANIVLKTGDTLHSKVALFDREISVITSYNLHPRSELLEDEMSYIFASPVAAQQLRVALMNDIKQNIRVVNDDQLAITDDSLTMFINRLLYNQL